MRNGATFGGLMTVDDLFSENLRTRSLLTDADVCPSWVKKYGFFLIESLVLRLFCAVSFFPVLDREPSCFIYIRDI